MESTLQSRLYRGVRVTQCFSYNITFTIFKMGKSDSLCGVSYMNMGGGELRGLSPRANYTDRAAAAGRQS